MRLGKAEVAVHYVVSSLPAKAGELNNDWLPVPKPTAHLLTLPSQSKRSPFARTQNLSARIYPLSRGHCCVARVFLAFHLLPIPIIAVRHTANHCWDTRHSQLLKACIIHTLKCSIYKNNRGALLSAGFLEDNYGTTLSRRPPEISPCTYTIHSSFYRSGHLRNLTNSNMSFGWSFGDVISGIKVVWDVYVSNFYCWKFPNQAISRAACSWESYISWTILSLLQDPL
jgi:hypothetical protein